MRVWILSGLTFALLGSAIPALAADAGFASNRSSSESSSGPSLGLTALGGVAMPSCGGAGCEGIPGSAPSIRALALYQPSPRWGFGLAWQIAFVHWRVNYVPDSVNPTVETIESDLTAGIWGAVARYKMLPDLPVTPMMDLVVGSSYQAQTGSNFNCNRDFLAPTAQIGLGVSARVISALSLVAMADASGGIRGTCIVADGPPATPFAAWGYGVHVGASFDIGPGTGSSGSAVVASRSN